ANDGDGLPNSSPPFYKSFYHPDGAHCFYPNNLCNTGLKRELGAFADFDSSDIHNPRDTKGSGDSEITSTYNFIILDAGATGPQGDVVLDAAFPFGTTIINIEAYIDIHKRSGDIHIHTNGFIVVTEKPRAGTPDAGDQTNYGDIRVAQIQSTNDDVTLYSP